MRNNATKRIFARVDAMSALGAGWQVYVPPTKTETEEVK